MASAKKCDRCGNYYNRNANDYEGGKRGGNAYPYEHVHMTDKCAHGIRYDFCDNCIADFFMFMNISKDICDTGEQIKECKLGVGDGQGY